MSPNRLKCRPIWSPWFRRGKAGEAGHYNHLVVRSVSFASRQIGGHLNRRRRSNQIICFKFKSPPQSVSQSVSQLLLGVARFFFPQYTKNGGKYTKLPLNYPMAIKYTKRPSYILNGHIIYQSFPLQGHPKFTQIGIFWFDNVPSGNPLLLSFHSGHESP
jgi:hypothetical protein